MMAKTHNRRGAAYIISKSYQERLGLKKLCGSLAELQIGG
jgi:hypothetical protein